MSTDERVSRRRVVRGLVAVAGGVALAGCGEVGDDDGATDDDPNEDEAEDESDDYALGGPGDGTGARGSG